MNSRILYRDGIPIAFPQGDEVRVSDALDATSEGHVRMALFGHAKARGNEVARVAITTGKA
jgi:hypothetical protein